jgi:hypothetical protein
LRVLPEVARDFDTPWLPQYVRPGQVVRRPRFIAMNLNGGYAYGFG